MSENAIDDQAFIEAFLDDYYADCDEHLTAIRRNLIELERSVGKPKADPEIINELFRSFHTIKGLSGMVGFQEAEELAHQLESYLAALRDGRAALSQNALDILEEAVRTLEEAVGAHRAKQPIPDMREAIAQAAGLLKTGAAAAARASESAPERPPEPPTGLDLSSEEREKLQEALAQGAKLFRFRYTPNPELAARGVNVKKIRARLGSLGQVLRCVPKLDPTGALYFELLAAVTHPESRWADLKNQGVSWSEEQLNFPAPSPGQETPAPASASEAVSKSQALPEPPSSPSQPEPSAERKPLPEKTSASAAPSSLLRVDLGQLDELMRLVGELVIQRARLCDQLRQISSALPAPVWRRIQEGGQAMERLLRDLRETLVRIRLVPLGEVFQRLRFAARDAARHTGRRVRLEIRGGNTEVDKMIADRMTDPLLHLVRNAVSHGIEPPEERAAQGKPPEGRISLSASAAGDRIAIELADDGRGIDRAKVERQARAMGLLEADEPLDETRLLEIICSPGFSTQPDADKTSGRGVGMNAVRTAVNELRGRLTLQTAPGRGTRFVIELPLTLLIVDALLIEVSGHILAAPLPLLREVLALEPGATRRIGGTETLAYRSGVLPLIRLAEFFHWPQEPEAGGCALVSAMENPVGLVADRIAGQREIVVRPLEDPLVRVPGISGVTEDSQGGLIPILDVSGLIDTVRRTRSGGRLHSAGKPETPAAAGFPG